MKAKIKALFSSIGIFGGVLLYICLAVAILAVFFSALNVLAALANILAAASILILIPFLITAGLFKRARKFCGTGTLIISYAWGASTWLTAARQRDINAQRRLFATEVAVVLGKLQKP